MKIELPLYQQERDDTCALACLRMVLAGFGTHVAERDIQRQAAMSPQGTSIGELARLAEHFGLTADIQDLTLQELKRVLEKRRFAIAFIDRSVFDLTPSERKRHSIRHAKIHTVVPTLVSKQFVQLHDPLSPRIARKSIRLFRHAYEMLGGVCVVCIQNKIRR